MGAMNTLAAVLRDPQGVIERADEPGAFEELAPALLGIAAAGAGLFGLVVGAYRGGLQVPYAAIKMPILLGVPMMLALPATRALWSASGTEVSWQRTALTGLVAMARMGVLAAAAGPALWLVYSLGPGYHLSVLLFAATIGMVGLPGIATVARSVPESGRRRVLAMAGTVLVLGLCTAQTGWLLRPFIARPTSEIAFLRPVEEDVFSGLEATSHSAVGNYRGWDVEGSGLIGRGGQ